MKSRIIHHLQAGVLSFIVLCLTAAIPCRGQVINLPAETQTRVQDLPDSNGLFGPQSEPDSLPDIKNGFGAVVFKTILTLVMIILFIWLCVWFLKRFVLAKKTTGGVTMRMVSTMMLGPKKNLTLVEVHRRFFLLGVSENSVSLITELTGMEQDLKVPDRTASGGLQGNTPSFQDFFNTYFRKSKDAPDKNE